MQKKKYYKQAIIIFMIIVQLSACKPTPTTEPIVNKADNPIEVAILTTPQNNSDVSSTPIPYEVPAIWEEQIELKNSNVTIEAEITVPSDANYSAYNIKRHVFSSDELRQVLYAIAADINGVRLSALSREELLEDLLLAQRGHYVGDDENTGEPIFESYSGQKEEIEAIEKSLAASSNEENYSSLTDDSFSIPCKYVFRRESGARVYVEAQSNSISITTDRNATIQPERWVMEGDAYPGERPHSLENIHISDEDAENLVEQFIINTGLESMKISSKEKARILSPMNEPITEGWQIVLVQDDDLETPIDLNSYSTGGILSIRPENDYAASWSPEQITLFLDETGIRSFYWIDPLDIVGVANSNIVMLPFSEVQEKIRQYIKYGLSWIEEKDQKEVKQQIVVSRIALTHSIQLIENKLDEAYYVPAWVVFFTTEREKEANMAECIFGVSAIDGSLINLKN